jgi:hypothetical protein
MVVEMKERLVKEFGEEEEYCGNLEMKDSIYELPIWVAQPFIRPPQHASATTTTAEKRKTQYNNTSKKKKNTQAVQSTLG